MSDRRPHALTLQPAVGLAAGGLRLADAAGIAAGLAHHELDRAAPNVGVQHERLVGHLLDRGPGRTSTSPIVTSRGGRRAPARGDLVGVLESPPTGRPLASRVTRTPNGFSSAATYIAGGVAFEVRVRRQDHLGHVVALDAVEQLLHAEVVGADAVERADRATEDVEPPLDQRGLLDRRGVLRLFDDTEHCAVTRLVTADAAQIALGDVAALAAERDAVLGLHDRRGQALASAGSALTSQNARRWADFGPTPGSPASSSIRSWIGPSYTGYSARSGSPATCAPSISCTRRKASASSTTSSSSTISTVAGRPRHAPRARRRRCRA